MPDPGGWVAREPRFPHELHTDRPHAARVYDALLGGKTNYPADRDRAARVLSAVPVAIEGARANRAFMHRATRFLAAEAGVRQFLDIGSGIPTPPDLHEIAQAVDPAARIVYADNDPIVLTHSRALHTSTPEGRTAYVQADVTDPHSVLRAPELGATFDPARPVAITMCLLLHWLPRHLDPYAIVRTLMEPLPPGSALVVSHVTHDFDERIVRLAAEFDEAGTTVVPRSRAEFARFFDGLDLVEPGIAMPHQWRPGPADVAEVPADECVPIWAGVALKRS